MSITTTAPPTDTIRVWIGCLACYNEGRLTGDWYAASEAGEITTDDLHLGAGMLAPMAHEELWVMDHEGLPMDRECSPAEAQRLAEIIEAVDEWAAWRVRLVDR